jgi:hypothetical protein
MADRDRWILRIKEVRAEHGVGLIEAERIVLADANWRRWVEHQINSDIRCRRMALRHIREWGPSALIEHDGERLSVRHRG